MDLFSFEDHKFQRLALSLVWQNIPDGPEAGISISLSLADGSSLTATVPAEAERNSSELTAQLADAINVLVTGDSTPLACYADADNSVLEIYAVGP